jgi:plasmid stability protein
MARDDPQMKLRLPEDLRERIRDRAEQNGRSMNTEILSALTGAFPPSTDPLDLLADLGNMFDIQRRQFSEDEIAVFFEIYDLLVEEIKRLKKFDVR